MKQIQLFQMSPEELKEDILSGIKIQIKELKKDFQPKQPDELMTRQQTADMLKVDISTIHNYTKRGILLSYGIGNRIFYKRSEIQEAIIRIVK